MYRWGRYHRTLKPGMHWRWWFWEQARSEYITIKTLPLPAQSLYTRDHKTIIVSAIVKYQIQSVRDYYHWVDHDVDVLRDIAQGAIKQAVTEHEFYEWEECEKIVTKKVRREVKPYGIHILAVTYVDFGPIRSYRIIGLDNLKTRQSDE